MDPVQTPTQLDPKLKEMYDRIMAINVPAPAPQNGSVNASVPAFTPPGPTGPPAYTPPTPQPTPVATPVPTPAAPTPVTTFTSGQPQTVKPAVITGGKAPTSFVATAKKGGLGLKSVFLTLGIIIFLAVYTVFWLKFFNFPLPFSIPFLPS